MKKTVVVGMSGGVDSSVVACLLKKDYNVIGLFMNNWEEEENGVCTSASDWADVQAVAGKLKIPCYSVNFSKDYMENVFKLFLKEYAAGRTPNPDVLCNREIKFGVFRDYAKQLDADFIATGHYCSVLNNGANSHLLMAADENKDQTYFLNQVSGEQLSNAMFPLGQMVKSDVRKIAQDYGLVTAKKKDSTGICFIGERRFKAFLKEYLPANAGDIVDTDGKKIGRHDGLMYHTLGQRRGLNIGGLKGYAQDRWYVVDKDLKNNRLVVSCGEGEELLSNELITCGFNFIGEPISEDDLKNVLVKTRYRQIAQEADATLIGSDMKIIFKSAQRAVTPGQYAVIYKGNRCVGGGVIEKTKNCKD